MQSTVSQTSQTQSIHDFSTLTTAKQLGYGRKCWAFYTGTSRILRLEPASQPQNLRAEPQKFERETARSSFNEEISCP